MKLHFISFNQIWLDEIKKFFPEALITNETVENIPRTSTAFVSPANCLGFMDGGIDFVYSRKMFLGCELEVKKVIKNLGHTTSLGRNYFPIGSAFCIEVGESTGLICAPTMFLPHNVSTTRNAYLSFLASLLVFQKINMYKLHKFTTLVITSHCCGYGKMNEVESAKQMYQAYQDFLSGNHPPDSSNLNYVVQMPLYNDEQPDNYDNREIKEIPIERLLTST